MTSSEMLTIYEKLNTSDLFGCDCSFVNMFLYQKKMNLSYQIYNEVFFRFYDNFDYPLVKKCAFPIPLKNADSDFLFSAVEYLLKNFKKIEFCNCTEKQTNEIDLVLKHFLPEKKIVWKTDSAKSDYIYLQKNLAELAGQKYQKKKNHVNHFLKTYENNWRFETFSSDNYSGKNLEDLFEVEKKWFDEKDGNNSQPLKDEYCIIQNAIQNFENLHLRGGLIYINDEPVAMTLASPISESVIDIHFEKSLQNPAKNGAYSAINQFFAKTCDGFVFINREEDLGIEGLRKAKLSYKPEIILEKYSGIIE